VRRLCRFCGVTRAGYYAWRVRPPSAHAEQDRRLSQRIVTLFWGHHGRYGSPRLQRELRTEGWRVSRRRIERLMRAQGLRARVARVYRARPGLRRFLHQYPNRLPAEGPRRTDQVWVGDITYLPVAGRWWFLAVVLDQYSRRVVAWTLGTHRDASLTRRALNAAVRRRRPGRGLVFHSDRGPEYLAAPAAGPGDPAELRVGRAQGQCPHGILLPLAEGRARARPAVRQRAGAAAGDRPLRPVLQPPPAPLRARLPVAR